MHPTHLDSFEQFTVSLTIIFLFCLQMSR
jgi:hypothetical protein